MNEAARLVQDWLSNRGKSSNTIKAYVTDVKMFFIEMNLEEVELDELDELAARWMNSHRRLISPKTVARRITSMRALGRCIQLKVLAEYSTPTPPRALPHPLPRLAADLVAMARAASNDEQRCIIALTGMCGLRITEAREVEHSWFDLHNMILTVRGKGDKSREIPISREAWAFIAPQFLSTKLRNCATVLLVSDRHAREVITKLGIRAGVSRPVSSHDMRATFATLAYEASGNDIRAVQELLGHSSIEQTQLYTGVALAAMRKATNLNLFSTNNEEDDDD